MAGLFRSVYVVASGQAILGMAATAMLAVRVARPTQGRRISQEVIGTWAGEAILKLLNVKLVVHHEGDWPTYPCFYMSNHSSALDLPVLMALRLPNTRSFMKEQYRWYGSLGLVTMLTGTLFTAPQQDHDRRVERFKQAEDLLRRTGDSVYGSPEGTRVQGRDFGPFNRGIFHIATNLGLPIIPMVFLIPEETALVLGHSEDDQLKARNGRRGRRSLRQMTPERHQGSGQRDRRSGPSSIAQNRCGRVLGQGVAVGEGVIHVHVGEPIATADWTVEDVDSNKEKVRDHFVAWKKELQQ